MKTETQDVKIVRYIDDAIALEAASITALRDMAKDAVSTDERLLYEGHLTESENHKQRLEGRLIALGGEAKRSLLKDVMNSIGAAATNILHAGKNDGEKDTRNLMQAYAMESLEMAVYEALYAAANRCGDKETAQLAREIQGEESAMAKQVFLRISDSSILAVGAAA
jgi:ferritin-like metal-binding protein YciE